MLKPGLLSVPPLPGRQIAIDRSSRGGSWSAVQGTEEVFSDTLTHTRPALMEWFDVEMSAYSHHFWRRELERWGSMDGGD